MNNNTQQHTFSQEALQEAKHSLEKLPILGPAVWLYAKDPLYKFTFLAETDWTILPPIILDQCRLYTRSEIPFAFVTWAKVSNEVHNRLMSGEPKIAPHEWQNGENIWLINIVAPFGEIEQTIEDTLKLFPGQRVNGLIPTGSNPPIKVMSWDVPKDTQTNG